MKGGSRGLETDFGFTLRLEGTVSPTEDPAKVSRAVANVLGASKYSLANRSDSIVAESADQQALDFIRGQLRDRGVRAAARRLMERKRRGESVELMLNRQAAYQGVVALCTTAEESPLGPLYLRVRSKRLDSLIGWLTA